MNHLSSVPSVPTLASKSLPRIGITMGDPAGIGPEVVLKAVAEEDVLRCCAPIIIGDAQLLAHNARTLDLQCGYEIIRRGEPFPDRFTSPLIFHLDNIEGHIEPGLNQVWPERPRPVTSKPQSSCARREASTQSRPRRSTR